MAGFPSCPADPTAGVDSLAAPVPPATAWTWKQGAGTDPGSPPASRTEQQSRVRSKGAESDRRAECPCQSGSEPAGDSLPGLAPLRRPSQNGPDPARPQRWKMSRPDRGRPPSVGGRSRPGSGPFDDNCSPGFHRDAKTAEQLRSPIRNGSGSRLADRHFLREIQPVRQPILPTGGPTSGRHSSRCPDPAPSWRSTRLSEPVSG